MTRFSALIVTLGLSLFITSEGLCKDGQEAWHFTPADVNALHSKPADFTLSYADDLLQFGELRLPKGPGPFPVAIIIHRGCWLSKFASLQNAAALADALRDSGVAS